MNRELKEQTVSELREKFQRAKVAILTDYCGLNVDEMNSLRTDLRDEAVEYRVVKNTIVKLAAKSTELELLDGYFNGPTAVALSYNDQMSPAKILTKFVKDNPKLEIKAGVLQGKVVSPDDIKQMAEIPSREVLLAQMLSALTSGQAGLLGVFQGILSRLIHVLESIRSKKETTS